MSRAAVVVVALSACASPNEPTEWSTVFHDLDRVALSVASPSPDDVYIVGGGVGAPGVPALAMHWTGDTWRDLAPPGDETLWWVTTIADDVWMVGENGMVLRGRDDAFAVIAAPVPSTLFGAWAASRDDVWIVGGVPGAGATDDNDVVLHWDGQQLVRDVSVPRRGVALLKVWGSSSDDLWIAGEQGTLWHRTANGWEDHASGTSTLFSVHGCAPDDVYAIGGSRILHYDGRAWSAIGPVIYASAVGVACGPDGVLVTGTGGLKLRWERDTDTWTDEQIVEPWDTDFHGAAMDAGGGAWAVGGNFNQPSDDGPRVGVVAYHGARAPDGEHR